MFIRVIHQFPFITREQPIWLILISSLGFLTTLKKLITLLKWVFITFIRPSKDLKTTYGSWALVTGATDGIGEAFSHRLARNGLDLILVGRNPEKLKRVSKQIRSNSPETRVKTVLFDFSGDMSEGIKRIEDSIKGLDVGVLINNAGVTYPRAMYFHEVDESVWMNIVRVNLEGTTRVTRAVLKGMIGRKKKGAIVSIGSGASIVVPSHPLYAIYAATKAYVDQLSRCLYMEYKSSGIDVQCQVPLYVATKMASEVAFIDKTSLFVPSANDYVKAAVRRIGYEMHCTPYWAHSVEWLGASCLPDSVLDTWRLAIGLRRRRL